jgi:hypothetical protein
MPDFQPTRRIYFGYIELGPQPLTWIKTHSSFASKEWIISNIKFGEWKKQQGKRNCFEVEVYTFEGTKSITVIIKIRLYATHVFAYHAHVLR